MFFLLSLLIYCEPNLRLTTPTLHILPLLPHPSTTFCDHKSSTHITRLCLSHPVTREVELRSFALDRPVVLSIEDHV
jgi:hypothetical protein